MSNSKQFFYGGQAVIEGVMMRGAHRAAIAARDPSGEIQVKEVPLNAALYRGWITRTPFVRGLVGLWDALGLGTRALLWSADVALIEGSYYRIDYKGSVAWVAHAPSHMRVEGDLKAVPTLKDNSTDGLDPNSSVKLIIQANKPLKILAKPDLDAQVLESLSAGEFSVTGFFPKEKQEDVFTGVAATGMIVFSLAVGIGLFFILPTVVSSGISKLLDLNSSEEAKVESTTPSVEEVPADPEEKSSGIKKFMDDHSTTVTNLIEEAIKLTLFLGYLTLIAQLEDVKRLFRYHGAEHKTINAYEAGAELTPKTVQGYPIEHPRCGTAFLLNVIILSVIINTLIGRFNNNLLILIPTRLVTIPVVAGIAYEWLRITAKYIDNPIVRLLIKPNLALQHMTTREPSEDMLEVAIKALERVLVAEGITIEESGAVRTNTASAAASD